MTKTLTEQWREGTLEEANKTILDQELIIKRLKRRRICTNQKEKARKEHINELIAQVKELKEEVARRGRLINELKSQRKDANEVVKLYAETFVGNKNEDGTFTVYRFGNFPNNKNVCGYQELRYDPRPAKKYLKKWGVK